MQFTATLWPPRPAPRALARQLGAFLAYLGAVWLGAMFLSPALGVSLIWPAAGVAIAATWWYGPYAALSVAAAAAVGQLWLGSDPVSALAVAVGAAAAAAVAVAALRRLDFDPSLQRLGDVVRFLLVAVVGASAVSGLIGAAVTIAGGEGAWGGLGSLWWVCWVANMLGVLLVAPILLSAPERERMPRLRVAELAFMALLTLGASWLVYSDVLPRGVAMARPLSYVMFPIMIWVAVRGGIHRTALLLGAHAAIALYYTRFGHGPFADGDLRESLLALHAHLAMLSTTMLMLAALLGERRRATMALRRSEARYRLVVDNQTDLVLQLDEAGCVRFASPSVATAFGLPANAIDGSPFSRLAPDVVRVDRRADWREALTREPEVAFESAVATARGERWFAWLTHAVRGEDGVSVIAVGRDVTDRRRAEEASNQYLRELAHVGRVSSMGEMAAGLAHELNQPLCAITTYAQASLRLADESVDPALRRAIERVAANSQRAGEIIRRMRGFVRKGEADRERLDINAIVRETVDLIEPECRQSGVMVTLDLADDTPRTVGAAIHLQQILVNLARNAAEALRSAPEGDRRVRIATARRREGDGDIIAVRVEDNGPGIAPELLPRLFEPFVSGREEGMGLGLSLSGSIAESHGGALTGGNLDGGGAWFELRLPAKDDTEVTE